MNPSDTASTSHDGRTMMRAVRMEAFGPPDVLTIGVVPAPIAEQGQVVIDVAFANITFVETMFRATGFGPFSGDFWAVQSSRCCETKSGRYGPDGGIRQGRGS